MRRMITKGMNVIISLNVRLCERRENGSSVVRILIGVARRKEGNCWRARYIPDISNFSWL